MALVAASIIFLALVRTLAEPFRLQYYAPGGISYVLLKPLLIGALVAGIALFIITVSAFYRRFTVINLVSLATIILLMIVKTIFAIGTGTN